NINQKQRIIIFVASPLNVNPTKVPEELLKSLKKNGISLNFISIGNLLCLLSYLGSEALSANRSLINSYLGALENDTSTTLTEIEPTTYSLIDVIRSVKEVVGSESSAGGFEFGDVDPNLDPELALALKLSLEEEQARIAREQQQQQKQEP